MEKGGFLRIVGVGGEGWVGVGATLLHTNFLYVHLHAGVI